MADLVLDWGALGAYGTNLEDTAPDAVTTSVDTGGVNVDITFTAQDDEAQAFTVTYDGYVPEGDDTDPNSHLKLFGTGGDGGGTVSSTSTTVLDFSATDAAYTDQVENVSFLLNDVDGGEGSDLGDLVEYAGALEPSGFEDNVTILAYDAEGNQVEVTMTTLGGGTSVSGDTATGEEVTTFAEQDGTVQVSIAGPVSRIEIVYENGGTATQGVLISDVSFSTVDAGDGVPVANDDTATTDEDVAVTIDVLENDSDPDGDPLTVTSATSTNGTVVVNEDNTLTFTPDEDYNGPAEITYTIEDPAGNSATGTVDVTVEPVNDAPVAVDDTAETVEDTPVTLDPTENDTDVDGDPLTVSEVGDPANGDAVVNDDGTVTYTPDEGFTGEDTIPYTVDDGNGGTDEGVITVTVGDDTTPGGNTDPVAVEDEVTTPLDTAVTLDPTENDSDPEGDPLTVTSIGTPGFGTATLNDDGTVTYTPDDGFTGTDALTYTIDDGNGGTAESTIYVTVEDDDLPPAPTPNESPTAVDDTASTDVSTPVTVAPLENDSDPDGDPLTVTSITQPENGTATLNDDGTVTYTPVDGFEGDDVIPYTIDDGNGGTDEGVITVTVGGDDTTPGGNSPPDAVDDLYATTQTSPASFDPTLNDSDPDGDPLTVTSVGESDFGTVTLNEDGTVTYVADEGYTGYDSFSYTIEDGNGGEDSAFITVEVLPCFTPGTLIATPQGERLVEELEVGDRIITRDNGIQEIRWIGRRDLTGHELARKPHLKPVLIQQGALGKNLPEHDLLVSPNHRVLVANDKTSLYFEEREVLAAAKHLTGLEGVDEVDTLGVSYIHMMFDNHEVVLSNGAWTESFQPGDMSLGSMDEAQRQEIFELFPELEHAEGLRAYGAARRSLKKHEAQLLTR